MRCQILALSLGFCLLCAAAPLQAQDRTASPAAAQSQDEIVDVGTSVVQLDVIVTDKSGRRITNLTTSDFQLLDEDVARPVDFFAAIETSAAARSGNSMQPQRSDARRATAPDTRAGAVIAGQTSALATPYKGRHIALVFDDQTLTNENFLRSRQALVGYVKTKATPDDLLAVISTSGRLGSLQQFTNDQQRILSAINRLGAQNDLSRRAEDRRFNLTRAEAVRIAQGDERVLDAVVVRNLTDSIATQLSGGIGREGGGGESDALRQQIRAQAQTIVAQIAQDSAATIGTLANLFRSMAELPGRKAVVLLTESFVSLQGTTEQQATSIMQLADIARRGGVSVYALDAAGLRTDSATASERQTATGLFTRNAVGGATFTDFENLSSARGLAAATGGTIISNTNDIAAGLNRVIEDSSSYYVLGFTPAVLDNKFHRLTITVRNRPDLNVRTRRGYLAVNQETSRGTNTELAAALLSPVPRTDLPLSLVANVVPQSGEQVVLTGLSVGRNYVTPPAAATSGVLSTNNLSPAIATDASIPNATPNDDTRSAIYDVVAWIFRAGDEKPVGIVQRQARVELDKLKAQGFLFVPQPFTSLKPGQYQIRAAVRERATGRLGSAYQFFEVPNASDRKALGVSSVFITLPGQTAFTGTNTFKRSGEMDIRFIIYNPPRDATTITQRLRLLDGRGRTFFESPLPVTAAPSAVQVAGSASGGSFAALPQGTRLAVPALRGRYAVVIEVEDKRNKSFVERRSDFVVE